MHYFNNLNNIHTKYILKLNHTTAKLYIIDHITHK